jgi:hypothetical protein
MKCFRCESEMILIEKNSGLDFRRTSYSCDKCKIYTHIICENQENSLIIKKIDKNAWRY